MAVTAATTAAATVAAAAANQACAWRQLGTDRLMVDQCFRPVTKLP